MFANEMLLLSIIIFIIEGLYVNMTSLAMSFPVAQWLERPSGVREVMGLIPIGDSDFFFVPRL